MDEESVERHLECPICYCRYDNKQRRPQALRCQHTLCEECTGTLSKATGISCPTCRETTTKEDIRTNYALFEVVEALCEVCEGRKKTVNCDHCGLSMCAECHSDHVPTVRHDTQSAVDSLAEKLQRLTNLSADGSMLKTQSKESEDAKLRLRVDLSKKRSALDEFEQNMLEQVDDVLDENVHAHTVWREDVDTKLVKMRSFIHNAQRKVLRSKNDGSELLRIQKDCEQFSSSLDSLEASKPALAAFPTEVPQDVLPIAPIPQHLPRTRMEKVITKFANGSTDQTSVRLKSMTGSPGSAHEDFKITGSVAVIAPDDWIAVTDFLNDRVKIYSSEMKLLSIFGKTGDGLGEFNQIQGISVSPAGEIFVSDSENNRIQVFSKYSQYLRNFGRRGSRAGEFLGPAGSAFNKRGLLYVCDLYNYRIQVFMADGKFVRSFGSKGRDQDQFQDKPVYLALSNDLLYVSDFGGRVKVFRQDGRFVKNIPPSLPKDFGDFVPNGIAVDVHGNAIVAAAKKGVLVVLDPSGEFVCTVGQQGEAPGEFKGIDGVCVTSSGDLVVCDGRNSRVQVLRVCRRWDQVGQ